MNVWGSCCKNLSQKWQMIVPSKSKAGNYQGLPMRLPTPCIGSALLTKQANRQTIAFLYSKVEGLEKVKLFIFTVQMF